MADFAIHLIEQDQLHAKIMVRNLSEHGNRALIDLENPDLAEREIRSVIRVFRWIGWVGTVLYVPMVIIPIGVLLYSVFVDQKESLIVVIGASLVNGIVLAYFLFMLSTASRMIRRELRAERSAKFGSCIMMIGFPIFTIVGVMCLSKLRQHYLDFISGSGADTVTSTSQVSPPAPATRE